MSPLGGADSTNFRRKCVASDSKIRCKKGKIDFLYSDNHQSFLAARTQISKLHEALQSRKVIDSTTSDPLNIKWVTFTPQTPNTNAVNEALVKISKTAFKKIFKNGTLTEQEVRTIVASVEQFCNSRPLAVLPTDVGDFSAEVLSPSYFLYRRNSMQMPCLFNRVIEPPSLPGTAARWKRRSSVITQFNNLFRKQYINTLRQLTQNYTKTAPIKPGDIVIVDTEILHLSLFPWGR